MARYLAAIEGSRGEATRLGTPSSGIRAQAQGWDLGIKTYGMPSRDPETPNADRFEVYVTSGSRGSFGEKHIGTVYLETDGTPTLEPSDWLTGMVDAFRPVPA